jgi:hypothetical protein
MGVIMTEEEQLAVWNRVTIQCDTWKYQVYEGIITEEEGAQALVTLLQELLAMGGVFEEEVKKFVSTRPHIAFYFNLEASELADASEGELPQ